MLATVLVGCAAIRVPTSVRTDNTVWRNARNAVVKQVVYSSALAHRPMVPREMLALETLPRGSVHVVEDCSVTERGRTVLVYRSMSLEDERHAGISGHARPMILLTGNASSDGAVD